MPYGEGSPELDNGFARIANETLDAIARTSLTDYEGRCVHLLWRKTYGWIDKKGKTKKEDAISYGQWANGTGIDRRAVQRVLRTLVNRHIFIKKEVNQLGKNPLNIWGFQKRYHNWNGYSPPLQAEFTIEVVSSEPPVEDKVVSSESPLPDELVSSESPVCIQVVTNPDKVVSSQPPEVVSSQPTTIESKDSTIEKDTKGTEQEKILKTFESLLGWEYDETPDSQWLIELIEDYPGVTALKIKECRDYHSSKPPAKKGPWKNRIRQWLRHGIAYEKKNEGVSHGKPEPGAYTPVKVIDADTGAEIKDG